MTTAEDTILANAAYAVEHTTPTGSDSTAPAAFVEWPFPTLADAQDRHFIIDPVGCKELQNTGTDSQAAQRRGILRFNIVIRRINEAMSARLFASAIAADVRGISDVVETYINESGGGVICAVSDAEAFFEKAVDGERSIFHCTIPFRVDFFAVQIVRS